MLTNTDIRVPRAVRIAFVYLSQCLETPFFFTITGYIKVLGMSKSEK